jgi:hypothetical protein
VGSEKFLNDPVAAKIKTEMKAAITLNINDIALGDLLLMANVL